MERAKKEAEAASKALETEAAKKRKAVDDKKKEWDEKKKELEGELRGLQKYLETKTKFIKDQMSKQTRCMDPYRMKDLATSIRLATEDKEKQAIQEREVQEKLRALMGKRYRGE